jgi:hypothetical protein
MEKQLQCFPVTTTSNQSSSRNKYLAVLCTALLLNTSCSLPAASFSDGQANAAQGIRVVEPKSGHRRAAAPSRREKSTEQRRAELQATLGRGAPVERAHAAFWLGEMGPGAESAVPALIQNLRHENVWVRRAAAKALGKIGSPRAVTPLIAALKDQNRFVVNSVVIALKKIGTPEARVAVKGHAG